MSDAYYQTSIGESVTARTETLGMCTPLYLGLEDQVWPSASFRELGPPDLCHVVKSSGTKAAQKDVRSLPPQSKSS